MDRILLFGFLEELDVLDETAVNTVIDEVREEMFVPDSPSITGSDLEGDDEIDLEEVMAQLKAKGPHKKLITPNGNEVQDAEYYKAMIAELVDALDDAIAHKVQLTQYIDKMLKKKDKKPPLD